MLPCELVAIDQEWKEVELCLVFPNDVFGKVFDSRKNKSLDGKKIIYINGLCIFGGVEVR